MTVTWINEAGLFFFLQTLGPKESVLERDFQDYLILAPLDIGFPEINIENFRD